MNRTIAAVILLTFSLVVAITSHFYLKNTCDSIVSGIDDVLEDTLTQNTEAVNRLTVLLNTRWEKENIFMKILLGQKETATLQNQFENAVYYAEIQDFEALTLTLSELREELYRIKESYEPELQTIL